MALEIDGPFKLTDEARAFGVAWYKSHFETPHPTLDDARFGGYLARKQTHIHKLAMILSVSRNGGMVISKEDLQVASEMVTDLEPDMAKVFAKIGQSDVSVTADRLIAFLRTKGKVGYMEAFRHVHAQLPSLREFEDVLNGCVRAGYMEVKQFGNVMYIISAEYMALQKAESASANVEPRLEQVPENRAN